MNIINSLKNRRSHYNLGKNIKVSENELESKLKEVTELVPDAFDMKSAKIVVLLDKKHELLWEEVNTIFENKISREKIDSFKNAYGTILFFYDEDIIKQYQAKFSAYADSFPTLANQSNAMLQIAIWSLLSELNIGASLQHYNPIIDERIKEVFNIPQNYTMVAQMPFGSIISEPKAKEKEDINKRVSILK